LPALVHALTPAVEAAQKQPGDLLANAIRGNVAMTVDRLKTTAPILKAAADDNKLRVVGGVYALKSGRVELLS
jgi:carbonic anhydrase